MVDSGGSRVRGQTCSKEKALRSAETRVLFCFLPAFCPTGLCSHKAGSPRTSTPLAGFFECEAPVPVKVQTLPHVMGTFANYTIHRRLSACCDTLALLMVTATLRTVSERVCSQYSLKTHESLLGIHRPQSLTAPPWKRMLYFITQRYHHRCLSTFGGCSPTAQPLSPPAGVPQVQSLPKPCVFTLVVTTISAQLRFTLVVS